MTRDSRVAMTLGSSRRWARPARRLLEPDLELELHCVRYKRPLATRGYVKSKRTFISYSHDSQAHKEWVLGLATTLRARGVDVVLDQWDVDYGDDLPRFMETSITTSGRVIAVCTDQYIRKANEGIGGVGYEKTICTAEMLRTEENRRKFIPIVRNVSGSEKLPTFFGAMYYADLSDGQDEEVVVTDLIRRIHEIPKTKPPLGPSPFVPDLPSPEQHLKEEPQNRFRLGNPTIVEFSNRFSHAFPGLRGIEWIEDADVIERRLGVLLRQPLAYDEGNIAWWWRGHRNLQVDSFKHVEGPHYLMDGYELNILRIAAVNMKGTYYRKWLYVETNASEPTQLYPDRGHNAPATEAYDYEEYGLVDGTLPVTRAEFDDGATIVGGNPVKIAERAELRVRLITTYNFLLAPHRSPINNDQFDGSLECLLDAMLRGEDVFGRLCESIERLPLRHHR